MKKKLLSVTGIVFLIVLLAAAGGIWYWNTHKKKIIRGELDYAIREKSKGLYKIDYTDLEMDEVNGYLSVSSFILKYDSLKFEQLKKENKEPFLLFTISIPQMQISGVETPRAMVDKEISGRHLSILNPVIEITYTHEGKDSTRSVPDKEIYEQILGGMNLIKLDSVTISGAKIVTKDLKTGKTGVEFQNTSILLLDVAVDSTADADKSRILFAKEVNLDCEKFTWQDENKLYNYQVDSLSFRSKSSDISLKNLFITPLLKEDAFARNNPSKDRMDVDLHNVQFKNTDFYSLMNEVIKVDTLVIGSASFKIYCDQTVRTNIKSKVGSYPHQLIQKIPVQFDIKKAIVKNAFLEYKERNKATDKSGKVQFQGCYVNASNITNIKEVIADNKMMVYDIQSRLLNKIPISVKWTFHLANPDDGRFDLSGKMGKTEVATFNVLAEPMGPATLNSGHLDNLEFNFSANNYQLNGKVKMLYDDLNVSLLKKDEDSVHFKKKGVASFLANMKIKNANPEKGKDPRTAEVNYKRNTHKSMFNFCWKGLFEGVKEITGAK